GGGRHCLGTVDDGQTANLELLDSGFSPLGFDKVTNGSDTVVEVEEVCRGVAQGRLDGLIDVGATAAEVVTNVARVKRFAVLLMQCPELRQARNAVVGCARSFNLRMLLQGDVSVTRLVRLLR